MDVSEVFIERPVMTILVMAAFLSVGVHILVSPHFKFPYQTVRMSITHSIFVAEATKTNLSAW